MIGIENGEKVESKVERNGVEDQRSPKTPSNSSRSQIEYELSPLEMSQKKSNSIKRFLEGNGKNDSPRKLLKSSPKPFSRHSKDALSTPKRKDKDKGMRFSLKGAKSKLKVEKPVKSVETEPLKFELVENGKSEVPLNSLDVEEWAKIELDCVKWEESDILMPEEPIIEAVKPNPPHPSIAKESAFTGSLINYLINCESSRLALNEQNIFTEEEVEISRRFLKMDRVEQDLYARLFSRTPEWIREEKISYKFVRDLTSSLNILEYNNFITTRVENQPLDLLLDLLQVPELKKICSKMKVLSKGKTMNKGEMKSSLLQTTKVHNLHRYFSSSNNKQDNLKKCVLEELRRCVKLLEVPRKFFNLLLIVGTYAHFQGDEKDRGRDLVDRLINLKVASVEYPKFKCRATPVFTSLQHLKDYEASLKFSGEFNELCEQKNWDLAKENVLIAKQKMIDFFKEEKEKKLLQELPPFLWKFTCGYKYCATVSRGIEVLKKFKEEEITQEILECIDLLLSQTNFCGKVRGKWYQEKAIAYEKRVKDLKKVHEAVLGGILDESVDIISKRALTLRGKKLVKRKKSGLSEGEKSALTELFVELKYIPRVETIIAKPAPSSGVGYKQIFMRKTSDGAQEYSSVEETVILNYRERNENCFQKGLHDEGKMVKNLALACFWDVIYGQPENIQDHSFFHSQFQSVPLDWSSTGFYKRRETDIQRRADLMQQNGINKVMEILEDLCKGNSRTAGIVDWELINEEMLHRTREFLDCIGADVFTKIAVHFLKNFKLYRSGFPDLTLWDPSTSKCIFVEVKGPSDTLSDSQLMWLENLNSFGAKAEVCKVELK